MSNCPTCGSRIDGATAADGSGDKPFAGAVCICISCSSPSVFTGNGYELREMNPAEFKKNIMEPEFLAAILAVRELIEMRKEAR